MDDGICEFTMTMNWVTMWLESCMLPEFALSRVYLLVISRLMSAYDFYSQRVNNDLFIIYITRFLSEQNSKINISLFSLKGKQSAVKSPHSSRLALKWLPCKILYNTHTRTHMRGCVHVCVALGGKNRETILLYQACLWLLSYQGILLSIFVPSFTYFTNLHSRRVC